VVAQVCDRVLVMYAGRVIEEAGVRDLFHDPRHPYTKALLDSIPRSGRREHGKRLATIPGIVPSLFDVPDACRFHERCAYRQELCTRDEPELEHEAPARRFRCHFPLGTERAVEPRARR
jgi:peptide/nickel transport system ATP-binding protein/oligopeptide transport system ATP-binding protein